MNKTTEKILSLLDKYQTAEEIIEVYQTIKATLTTKLQAIQKEAEEKANKIQGQIELISG